MKLLLDTHALLWFYLGDARLSTAAAAWIIDPANEIWISPAVFWEIAIKVNLGKLVFAVPYQQLIDDAIGSNGFKILPIETRHTAIIASLPLHHRDPFDRMLIAQAIAEDAAIVSIDTAMDAYSVQRLW